MVWSNKLSRNSQILILKHSQLKRKFQLFSIVFQNLQLLVSLELIDQLSWDLLLNVALKMLHNRPANFGKQKFIFWHPKFHILHTQKKIIFSRTKILKLNFYQNICKTSWRQQLFFTLTLVFEWCQFIRNFLLLFTRKAAKHTQYRPTHIHYNIIHWVLQQYKLISR